MLILILNPSEGFSNTLTDEFTAGYFALKYKRKANFWNHFQLVAIDGAIDTSPPDTKVYDRRLEALLVVGKDFVLSGNLGFRLNVKADWRMKKEEESKDPKSPVTDSYTRLDPDAVITYITPKGMELFFGAQYHYEGTHTQDQESAVISSDTKFDPVGFMVPRYGMVKRGGSWSGSFYLVQGKEGKQSFKKTASDGSNFTGVSLRHIPTEYGIAAEFGLFSSEMELDIAAVQAGEGGEKSLDGVSVQDDHLRIRLSSLFKAGSGGVKVGLFHKTLSYSSNAFMSIDTIPSSHMSIDYLMGSKDNHSYFGLDYGKANDGQSIPEFNASYNFQSLGFRFGMFYPM